MIFVKIRFYLCEAKFILWSVGSYMKFYNLRI